MYTSHKNYFTHKAHRKKWMTKNYKANKIKRWNNTLSVATHCTLNEHLLFTTRKRGRSLAYRRQTFVRTCGYHNNRGWSGTNLNETRHKTGPPQKYPLWYKNLGHISYTGRVISNFLWKHPNLCYGQILLTAVLPYCKSRPVFNNAHTVSEHQCYTPLF